MNVEQLVKVEHCKLSYRYENNTNLHEYKICLTLATIVIILEMHRHHVYLFMEQLFTIDHLYVKHQAAGYP